VIEPTGPTQSGAIAEVTRRTKDGDKPDGDRRTPGAGLSWVMPGKAPPERPTFQPYRGKPAVRNDRGDRGRHGVRDPRPGRGEAALSSILPGTARSRLCKKDGRGAVRVSPGENRQPSRRSGDRDDCSGFAARVRHRCDLRTGHDSERHDTVSLLAGIDLVTGKVNALVKDRHRIREFIEFLELLYPAHPPPDGNQADPRQSFRAYLQKNTRAGSLIAPALPITSTLPETVLDVQRNRHVLSKIWTVLALVDVTPVEYYEKLARALKVSTKKPLASPKMLGSMTSMAGMAVLTIFINKT
jgi:hypothetical protein